MGLKGVLRTIEGGCLGFWCPGCEEMHVVNSGWTFDGNYDAPTFSPSVLVTSGHYAHRQYPHLHGDSCWCTYNRDEIAAGREPSSFKCEQCHSFVRAGQIQFLSDCTHAMAGRTVPLCAAGRLGDEQGTATKSPSVESEPAK